MFSFLWILGAATCQGQLEVRSASPGREGGNTAWVLDMTITAHSLPPEAARRGLYRLPARVHFPASTRLCVYLGSYIRWRCSGGCSGLLILHIPRKTPSHFEDLMLLWGTPKGAPGAGGAVPTGRHQLTYLPLSCAVPIPRPVLTPSVLQIQEALTHFMKLIHMHVNKSSSTTGRTQEGKILLALHSPRGNHPF